MKSETTTAEFLTEHRILVTRSKSTIFERLVAVEQSMAASTTLGRDEGVDHHKGIDHSLFSRVGSLLLGAKCDEVEADIPPGRLATRGRILSKAKNN
jgi:hypothetical protein